MNRYQPACIALIASAVLLAALLLVQVARTADTDAHADMLIDKGNFMMMTALTKDGEESLFLLDNTNAVLYIYNLDITRKNIELVRTQSLRGNAGGGGVAGGGGR